MGIAAVKLFRLKKNCESIFGPNFTFGDQYEFNITFKFYHPQKGISCVISRILGYRAWRSTNGSDLQSWKSSAVIWYPRSTICIMDLPADYSIFLHGNGHVGKGMDSPAWRAWWATAIAAGLWPVRLETRADVGTGQTSERTTRRTDNRTDKVKT